MKIKYLVYSILLCQLAGLLGSVFTFPAITSWYAGLNKPVFGPPNWLFGPVWLVLYTLMGISLALVWSRGINGSRERRAVILFLLQLALNSLWSVMFFGLHLIFPAFLEILTLLIFIILTTLQFSKLDNLSAYLLFPYIIWVGFASFLNYSLWVLNR